MASLLFSPAGFSSAYANPLYSGIVVESNRQIILYEKNAGEERHPASLTKVMTLYLTFEAIKNGKFTWDTRLPVSDYAASKPQTNMGLKGGERVRVQDLVDAAIIHSANDAVVVLGEAIAGSEEEFAERMTRKARQLGMKDTVYRNANGLPDPEQVTTARDQVRLALAMQKHFPDYYPLFKKTSFTYKGRTFNSHNRVTRYYDGATGLKTGFIRASGFNLITTANRNGHEVIGVVMGGQTSKSRDNHMITLLDTAFAQLNSGKINVASRNGKGMFDDFTPTPGVKPDVFETALSASPVDDGPAPAANDTELAQGAEDEPIGVGDLSRPNMVENLQLAVNRVSVPAREPADAKGWGIQVGTFSNPKDAMMAAANAQSVASQSLHGSVIKVMNVGTGANVLHRAHIANLSQDQARQACRQLLTKKEACFVFRNATNL